MAIINFAKWTALLTVIVASVKAHLEFQGTNNKITRYNAAILGLNELKDNWGRLKDDWDRYVPGEVERFVFASEELIKKEYETWNATSQVISLTEEQIKKRTTNSTTPTTTVPTTNASNVNTSSSLNV